MINRYTHPENNEDPIKIGTPQRSSRNRNKRLCNINYNFDSWIL